MATSRTSYIFITNPSSSLFCMVCSKVRRVPKQHGDCGKLICSRCLQEHGEKNPCPACKTFEPSYFTDMRIAAWSPQASVSVPTESHALHYHQKAPRWPGSKAAGGREIDALPVRCNNLERSCTWEGTVDTLKEHMTKCPYSLLPCPNTCMGEEQNVLRLMRKDIEMHMRNYCPQRDYECKDCRKKGTYFSIQVHGNNCEQKIVLCQNVGCTEKIERAHIREHMEEQCRHALLACKFANVGCSARLKRSMLEEHERNAELHLHLAMDAVVRLQRAIAILRERTDTMPTVDFVTFKLTEFESNRRRNRSVMSPAFYTSPNGYKISLKVYPNGHGEALGSHISAYIHILTGQNDQTLSWPLMGSVTMEMLNQLTDQNHHSKMLRLRLQENARATTANKGWGYTKFFPLPALEGGLGDEGHEVRFLGGDSLYFRVAVVVTGSKAWLERNLLSGLSNF